MIAEQRWLLVLVSMLWEKGDVHVPNLAVLYIHNKNDVESKNKDASSPTYLISISIKTVRTTCNSPRISLSALIPPLLLFFFFSSFYPYHPLHCSPASSCLLPSFLCWLLGIRHLIVTGVEANSGVKNTETLCSYCPKQKQQAWALRKATYTQESGCQCTGAEAEYSKLCLCLFVCMWVYVFGRWGGTSSFIASLSLALSLQGLNRLPFWAPTTASVADPPLPRSSSSLRYCSSLSSFA